MVSQQDQEPEDQQPVDAPFGSSKGEMISMVLFGLMVIMASVCFVIW